MSTANVKNSLDDRLHEAFLADLGELAGPLTHEFNDLLNTLTLQLALLKQTDYAAPASNLQAIRGQINHVAGIILRFQRRRHHGQFELADLDVNAILRDVVGELPTSASQTAVMLELKPALPKVRGHETDLRRLCRFLLGNAVRAVPPSGLAVVARSFFAEEGVRLQVEDAGPNVSDEALPYVFKPGHEQREGMCCLELAACRSIVRRLRGTLQVQARAGGGLIVAVSLPPATP
jgi:signal transduction histidine kinase